MSETGTRATPFVFYEGYDDLSWAMPGDHLVPQEGPVLVLTENGWEPL